MTPYIFAGLPGKTQLLITENRPYKIIAFISEYFSIPVSDIRGKIRKDHFVVPRQISAYFIKKYTTLSLEYIGSCLNQDHSTIKYSIKTVEERAGVDRRYRQIINEIQKELEG